MVEQIARDLRASFPGTQCFSARNFWDMRRLYEEYSSAPVLRQLAAENPRSAVGRPRRSSVAAGGGAKVELLRQLVAEVPWGHHLVLLGKVSDSAERIFYLKARRGVHFGLALCRAILSARPRLRVARRQ